MMNLEWLKPRFAQELKQCRRIFGDSQCTAAFLEYVSGAKVILSEAQHRVIEKIAHDVILEEFGL